MGDIFIILLQGKCLIMMKLSMSVIFSPKTTTAIIQTNTGVVWDMIARSATVMYLTQSTLVAMVTPLIADLKQKTLLMKSFMKNMKVSCCIVAVSPSIHKLSNTAFNIIKLTLTERIKDEKKTSSFRI